MVMAINFSVNDFGNLIFKFALDFDRWGGRVNAVLKGVGVSGFKEVHMEDIVNLVHGMR
jgi:hypothetical protein